MKCYESLSILLLDIRNISNINCINLTNMKLSFQL